MHFLDAKRFQRSSLLPHGPGQLPECDDLPQSNTAEEGNPDFHYALNPTGFLMLGSTEGLLGAGSELFEMSDKKQKIFRKRPVPGPVAFGFSLGKPEPEQPEHQ